MPVDYGRWVSRTWEIFSRYRVLWLLGLISALISSGTSGYSSVFQRAQSSYTMEGTLDPAAVGFLTGFSCIAAIVLFALSFIGAAAAAALIRTTDHIERTQEEPQFATAWGLGWPKMFPVWIFNLVLGLFVGIVVVILLLPAIIIGGGAFFTIIQQAITLSTNPSSNPDALNAAGGALGVACLCLCGALLLIIPIGVAAYLTGQFGVRALVLEDQGIFEAISTGWRMVRANLGKALVGLLIMFVIGVIVTIITGIITTPIGLILGFSAVNLSSTGISARPIEVAPLVVLGLLTWLIGAAVGTFTTAFTSVFWTTLYRNLRGMPNSDLAPAGMMPVPGGSAYGSPYGAPPPYTPPPGAPTQVMPPYSPPAGAPPPYPPPYSPPAGGPPPYSPPAGGPPPYTPPEAAGGVQYGSPYSPPPPAPEEPPAAPPDDRARGPETGSGPTT